MTSSSSTDSALRLVGAAGAEASTAAEGDQDHDLFLVQQCLRGDDLAWRNLLRKYEQEVVRQMWRFTRDRVVCEELTQDVFVQVYRSLPRFESRGVPVLHWIRRIATHVGYGYWRSQKQIRQTGQVSIEGWDRAVRDPEAIAPGEAAKLLHDLLAELPAADRLVLTLHYFENLGTKEISERTGWNRALVKVRSMRARSRLKKTIESRGLRSVLEMT